MTQLNREQLKDVFAISESWDKADYIANQVYESIEDKELRKATRKSFWNELREMKETIEYKDVFKYCREDAEEVVNYTVYNTIKEIVSEVMKEKEIKTITSETLTTVKSKVIEYTKTKMSAVNDFCFNAMKYILNENKK